MKIKHVGQIKFDGFLLRFDEFVSLEKAAEIIARYNKRFNRKTTISLSGPFKSIGAYKSCYHINKDNRLDLKVYEFSGDLFVIENGFSYDFKEFHQYMINHNLRLLVVDDDFNEYDTPQALESAIDKLGQEALIWSYTQCTHADAVDALEDGCDAILIDNDFGEGMRTLPRLVGTGIPIGYVTAYDLDGLILQKKNIPAAKDFDPEEFKNHATLIRKPGKNIAKDLPVESLEESIYSFLK